MKRFVAALAMFAFVSQANAMVLLVPPGPFAAAAVLGFLMVKLIPQPEEPNTIVTPLNFQGYDHEKLEQIALFPNSDLYSAEKGKLASLRDAVETKFGADTRLGDVPGMAELLDYKWSGINIKKQYKNPELTMNEFFGTAEAPKYANLAAVARRVAMLCTYHKQECMEAGGMVQIDPQ